MIDWNALNVHQPFINAPILNVQKIALGHEPWMLNSAIVSNLESATGGSSDNADTFAGYLTYGAGNPSPDVPSSPSHHVLTACTAGQQQVRNHLQNM